MRNITRLNRAGLCPASSCVSLCIYPVAAECNVPDQKYSVYLVWMYCILQCFIIVHCTLTSNSTMYSHIKQSSVHSNSAALSIFKYNIYEAGVNAKCRAIVSVWTMGTYVMTNGRHSENVFVSLMFLFRHYFPQKVHSPLYSEIQCCLSSSFPAVSSLTPFLSTCWSASQHSAVLPRVFPPRAVNS